jgi:hypothetical protein
VLIDLSVTEGWPVDEPFKNTLLHKGVRMRTCSIIVSGVFCGAEIEPGTFHHWVPRELEEPRDNKALAKAERETADDIRSEERTTADDTRATTPAPAAAPIAAIR